MYEVEQKFPISDAGNFERLLSAAGARLGPPQPQSDTYFAHPSRDFAATDEALRIRRAGDANFVTYKGRKVDAATKTRREIEIALPPGDDGAREFAELLQALGFRPVAVVRKERRTAHLVWQGRTMEVALDAVADVGTFVELETAAHEAELDAARACLAGLASQLNLSHSERRSYLEMLLEKRASTAPRAP